MQIGFALDLPINAADGIHDFCTSLHRNGLLAVCPEPGQEFDRPLPIAFSHFFERVYVARVTGQLIFTRARDGNVAVSSNSFVQPQMGKWLRAPYHLSEASLKVAKNFRGLGSSYRSGTFSHQSVWAGSACERFLQKLAELAKVDLSALRGKVWIRSLGVAKDFNLPEADNFVRDMSSGIIGSAHTTTFSRFSVGDKSVRKASWTLYEGDPGAHAYAQRENVLRTEITIADEAFDAIAKPIGLEASPVNLSSATNLPNLIEQVAANYMPYLRRIERYFEDMPAPNRWPDRVSHPRPTRKAKVTTHAA